MLRKPIAVLLVVAGLCVNAEAQTPEASLELGLRAFRAGDYSSARVDLAAAAAAATPADVQTYVSTGQTDRLQSFATTLVYLALSQFRLANEDDARAAIMRLLEVERVAPTYTTLPLQAGEATEFETLVAALVPGTNLRSEPTLPLPAVRPVVPKEPEPVAVQPKEPEPVAVQRREPERIVVEPRLLEPAAPAPRAPEPREPEPPLPPLPARPAAISGNNAAVREALNSLRQAEAFADEGELGDAEEIYVRLAAGEPREIVAAAAVGLYRTGAYREAVQAFRRLGMLGRGEEDLHYYFAVSLYESGEYEAARHELMCALPYIELTDEVARYRVKIEQAVIHQS